jgi:hypothetical protein
VLFVDICHSLSEVVLGTDTIVHTLKSQDGLVDVLGNFGSEWRGGYLLKERNLALTQSLTCLPTLALVIFLALVATASDIWLYN